MHSFGLPSPERFVLVADDGVLPLVEPWIPLNATRPNDDRRDADIRVKSGYASLGLARRLEGRRLLRLGSARAFRLADGNIELQGEFAVRGAIDMLTHRAIIDVESAATDTASADVYSMLTISAALLLGLHGMALVHAGAVVDRAGGAWLVVGDSHSGKSSTCTALCDAGWSFLADDQVVLAALEDDTVTVRGWPRRGHLDTGWSRAELNGERESVDLLSRWPGPRVTSAPLVGVLLPRIRAEEPTRARGVAPADVLTELIRQSPWLITDSLVASRTLPLMERASRQRAISLSLGKDSYTRGDVIEARLQESR